MENKIEIAKALGYYIDHVTERLIIITFFQSKSTADEIKNGVNELIRIFEAEGKKVLINFQPENRAQIQDVRVVNKPDQVIKAVITDRELSNRKLNHF